jgi:ABC-type branched-subunit amino acid transport system ATPase component
VSEPLLQVSGLSKHFGGVQAVDKCEFTVAEHSVVGLIGPNGAGKSTAINLISGFLRPDAGSVRFQGVEIVGRAPHEISRMGLIRTFQTPHEWASLTVFDNLMLAHRDFALEALWRNLVVPWHTRRVDRTRRQQVREAAATFGLAHLINEPAGNLSGGQKRLVEFARIAIAAPKMVILDEPMGGVNPVLGERIGQAIRDLVAVGSSVLIVEHNLRFIEETCSSVVVMDQGSVIAEAPYASLRDNQRVVDAYLGSVQDHV